MSTITFTQTDWDAFKATLAAHGTDHTDAKASLDSALGDLEKTATYAQNPSHRPSRSPSPVIRCDASTQLYTVRAYYLSAHILHAVHQAVSVRHLARQVASLSCRLLAAYDAVWSVLACHAIGTASLPDAATDWDEVAIATSAALAGDAQTDSLAQRAHAALTVLDADVVAALCTRDATWRRRPTGSTITARDYVTYRLTNGSAAASLATDRLGEIDVSAVGPFLCRRCRQDQRGDYAYDKGNRRLAGVGSKASSSHKPISLASAGQRVPSGRTPTKPPRAFNGTLTRTNLGSRVTGNSRAPSGSAPPLSATGSTATGLSGPAVGSGHLFPHL